MKKTFGRVVLVSILAVVSFAGYLGQVFADEPLLFGENHSYSVTFRGNGEAIVYAKIVFTNTNNTPLTDYSFEIPKVTVNEMSMFQMKIPKWCIEYDSYTAGPRCLEYSKPPDMPMRCLRYDTKPLERTCKRYNNADYLNYYPSGNADNQAEYSKINFTQSGSRFTLKLPYPVIPNTSSAIILSFSSDGYAKESFGLYSFAFETIKIPTRIQNVNVSVDVDSELYLKGKRSNVNYRPVSSQIVDLGASASFSSKSFDRVVSDIGKKGPIVKSATNLSANESFTVNGKYAKSWFRLNLKGIVIAFLIIAGIILGLYFGLKYYRKRQKLLHIETDANKTSETALFPKNPDQFTYVNHAITGLISAFIVSALSYSLDYLDDLSFFRNIRNNGIELLLVIMLILFYILSIFGPAVLSAIKHGWKSLVYILIWEFIFFVVFIIVYVVILEIGGGGSEEYNRYY